MPFIKDDDNPLQDTDPPSPMVPSPGRDSSRLMQDFIEHTFADSKIHTNPPRFDPTKPHSASEPSHTHSWIMKTRDSTNTRPWNLDYEDQSIVALCETCRLHMSLLAILNSDNGPTRCGLQGSDNVSHHLHLKSWSNSTPYSSSSNATVETKSEIGTFQCCQCPFEVQVEFRSHIVPESLVTSPKKRKLGGSTTLNIINRNKDSKSSPSPHSVYGTLATYCTDVLNNQGRGINVAPDSVFARKVGLDPVVFKFMEFLGWWREETGIMLMPPQWDESLERGRLQRKLLECAEIELAQLAFEASKDVDKSEKKFEPNTIRAESSIAKLMSAPWPRSGADRSSDYFRKTLTLDNRVNPSFVSLGTVHDIDETTIINAYEKQVKDDPANIVFYLECLQDIASSMQIRKIIQFADAQVLKGTFTRFDLQRACRTLEINDWNQITDDGLFALFHSRCADAPQKERDFQFALQIIQHFRRGDAGVREHTGKRPMDIHEAYRRLLITDVNLPDDDVIAYFASGNINRPNERDLLIEALQVIGKERSSLVIRSFLDESQVSVGPLNRQMSLDEAYIILGIEGGAKHDDEAIRVSYTELVALQPERTEEFKKAIEVIADDRDSIPLKTFLIDMITTPDKQEPGPGSETTPVGLENVAQTCYMNSLFQYYFTIKPLRDAILNYEEHEEGELTEEELKKKQISKLELDRSKRFIAQLRLLFQELITSNLAYIRPKEELVRLTLVDAKQEIEDEETKRRQSLLTNASQSILDTDIPDLIEIEDTSVPRAPVSSPTIIPTTGEIVPEMETPLQRTTAEVTNNNVTAIREEADYEFLDHESNGSGGVVSLTTSDPMSVDKENTSQSRAVGNAPSEKSPLQEDQQTNVKTEEAKDGEDVEMTGVDVPLTPPTTPPPVPQRPVQKRKSTWGIMKYGSQQDVTECITNCLSQLHAGFKPDEVDGKGDPIDLFKRLFYIRVKHVFRDLQAGPDAKPVDSREELYGSMVPVYVDAEIGGSLYDAIDLALGREKIEYQGVGECEKSTTVTYLPPFLQIQIVRAQFNRSVGAGYKENAHLELESKIYMDRYVESDDDDLSARRDDYWNWKVELERAQRKRNELMKKKGDLPLNPLEMLSTSRNFLERFYTSEVEESAPAHLIEGLEMYENHLRKQVEKLDKDVENLKSRIKQQFTDRRKHGYRLHSVFIHRGNVAYGHYWIYILDFAKNRWFKYNDEQVIEVDEKVVFADNSAEGAGPYLITYVKEDMANDLVEAVKRDLSGNLMTFD